jgi:hypothetical protein
VIIDRKFKPWLCVPSDDTRPILSYANIGKWREKDVLIAADGFIMVVLPVKLANKTEDGWDDVPGLVSMYSLKTAIEGTPALMKLPYVNIMLTDTEIVYGVPAVMPEASGLWRAPRYLVGHEPGPEKIGPGKYPDYSLLIEATMKHHAEQAAGYVHTAFNPALLNKVWAASGKPAFSIITTAGQVDPVIAAFRGDDGDPLAHELVPPFGLIMPVHAGEISNHLKAFHGLTAEAAADALKRKYTPEPVRKSPNKKRN